MCRHLHRYVYRRKHCPGGHMCFDPSLCLLYMSSCLSVCTCPREAHINVCCMASCVHPTSTHVTRHAVLYLAKHVAVHVVTDIPVAIHLTVNVAMHAAMKITTDTLYLTCSGSYDNQCDITNLKLLRQEDMVCHPCLRTGLTKTTWECVRGSL